MKISRYLDSKKKLIDRYLIKFLPVGNKYTRILSKAMKYSTVARSKRIRPILVLEACKAVGGDQKTAIPTACAIEYIHTYTLIHDDLPAMDNDDWRRGKPANHKVFGEDIAILSGDALSTLAFKIISESNIDRNIGLGIIKDISESLLKVVGGQVADLKYEGKKYSKKDLEFIHLNKTAALIRSSVVCGAMVGRANKKALKKMAKYGENLGLAFQIIDDILDVTSTRRKLGKTPRKDQKQKKATYPRLIGIERSQELADKKIDASIKALQGFGKRFNMLRGIAVYLGKRGK